MLLPGLAKKVTIHLNEDTSARLDFLYKEILQFLYQQGIAGATLILPQAGFGSHHRLHTARAEGAEGEHLPVRIEFIDAPAKVDALLPALCDMVSDGLIEVQDTTIVKSSERGGSQ